MKKAELQKPIRPVIEKYGFQHVNGDDFAYLSSDLKTKFCLRIPNGKKGFILGAQFADFGLFDGILSHSAMQQFDHAYDLAYGSTKDYSVDEIVAATERVCIDYEPYFINGKEEIRRRVNDWTFGDLDECVRNALLLYLGQNGIDPYSEAYFQSVIEQLSRNGGMLVLTMNEYRDHEAFYNRYTDFGAKIELMEKANKVYIYF